MFAIGDTTVMVLLEVFQFAVPAVAFPPSCDTQFDHATPDLLDDAIAGLEAGEGAVVEHLITNL